MDTAKAMKMMEQLFFENEVHFFKDYLETLEEFLRTEAQHLAQSLETLDMNSEPLMSNNQPSTVAAREPRSEEKYELLPEENDGASYEDDYEAEYEEYYEPSPQEVAEQLRDRLNMIDDFANLLRSSFFVSLYSFLELRLIQECQSRKSVHISLSLPDIRGRNDLDRIQKYFAKVLQVYFPDDTTHWQEIQNYRVLRNCIVHNRGTLSGFGEAKRLRDYIERNPELRISRDEVFLNCCFLRRSL